MHYIDEKFKDSSPAFTVEKIIGLLDNIGVKVYENGMIQVQKTVTALPFTQRAAYRRPTVKV